MLEEEKNYIYIVLSQTPTGFGRLIRRIMKIEYNHASIAFDKELNQLYSFGRRQNHVPIVAGLVKEYPERFSLKENHKVNIRIYQVPVTRAQYMRGKLRIQQIANDEDEYLYNLFSVLLFPLMHGFSTFKAFSCSEFVVYLLEHMGIEFHKLKHRYQYTPQEIGELFEAYLFYEGDLLEYCDSSNSDCDYFFQNPRYLFATMSSIKVIARLLFRKIKYRKVIY